MGGAHEARRSVLAVTYAALCDPTSGAAASLRDTLAILREAGWRTAALTGPHFEAKRGERPEPFSALRACGRAPKLSTTLHVRVKHALATYDDDGLTTTQFLPRVGAELEPDRDLVTAFGALLERQILAQRPSLLVTYGGGALGREIARIAQRQSVPLVFWLRNAAYRDPSLFDGASGILVGSRFLADHYRRTLGVDATPIPSPVRWERVLVPEGEHARRALTFVTPTRAKGLLVAARIFEEAMRRLPELVVDVVEGRGSAEELFSSGACIPRSRVRVVTATRDPRTFYADTRVLLAPSLWKEASLRSGIEAMINGVPTLGSDRGGIAETLGETGRVFAVPSEITPETSSMPAAHVVRPWVDAIVRLWTDPAHYEAERERCLRGRERYRWSEVSRRYHAFFEGVASRRARAETVGPGVGRCAAIRATPLLL